MAWSGEWGLLETKKFGGCNLAPGATENPSSPSWPPPPMG